jgi:hypothetical protein
MIKTTNFDRSNYKHPNKARDNPCIANLWSTFTPTQTKILEGGTKDEIRISKEAPFQGREYPIWAKNH